MSTLYVGRLPNNVTESIIEEFFQAFQYQVKKVKLLRDRNTGQPRGFAFVELAADADLRKAIQDLNGQSIDRNRLTVAKARPRPPLDAMRVHDGSRFARGLQPGPTSRTRSTLPGTGAQISKARPGPNFVSSKSPLWPGAASMSLKCHSIFSILSSLVTKAFNKKPKAESLKSQTAL